jgi:hypothetical protein
MHMRSLFAAFALAASISPAARAADVKAEAEQVNTLNGQLVEVGERNKYLLAYKPWNIGTNPVAWMYGAYSLSLSRALGDNLAIRGEAELLRDYLSSGMNGFGGVVAAPIYFKKMYDGFLLEPGFRYQNFDSGGSSLSYYGPQVLAGWHWMWDSGLNVSAALGMGRIWGSANAGESSNGNVEGTLGAGYLRVGYAFE